MKVFLFPYSIRSVASKALADSLGIQRVKETKSRFKGTPDKLLINWGNPRFPDHIRNTGVIINHPTKVARSSCKLASLRAFEDGGVRSPKFTTKKEEAHVWISAGHHVVCRSLLHGSAGRGITVASGNDDIINAPLYTRYVPKQDEYRVHVHRTGDTFSVFDVQRKMATKEGEHDWKIRTYKTGFIYGREDLEVPQDVLEQACNAVKALDLDFGAVDVMYQAKSKKAFVLEANTAPGLQGQTLENYSEMLRGMANGYN